MAFDFKNFMGKQSSRGSVAEASDIVRQSEGQKFQKSLSEKGLSPNASPEDKAWHEAEKGYTLGLGAGKKYAPRPEHITNDWINMHSSDVDDSSTDTPERQKSGFYEPLYKKAQESNPNLDRETFYHWMQQLMRD